MSKITILIALLALPSLADETYSYRLYFWKIPAVNIIMTLSDTSNNNERELFFTTRTIDPLSYFFSVDNSYKTVLDPETFQMIRYEKKVKQPNVEQELTIRWDPDDQVYVHEKNTYERPPGTHNVFSLLLRGRSMYREDLDTRWWDVDHEGRFFRSRYLWIDSTHVDMGGKTYSADHYRIDLEPTDDDQMDLVEVTDIFTWGIALEGCVRQIWIERGERKRILRAQVSVRGFSLTAELKE